MFKILAVSFLLLVAGSLTAIDSEFSTITNISSVIQKGKSYQQKATRLAALLNTTSAVVSVTFANKIFDAKMAATRCKREFIRLQALAVNANIPLDPEFSLQTTIVGSKLALEPSPPPMLAPVIIESTEKFNSMIDSKHEMVDPRDFLLAEHGSSFSVTNHTGPTRSIPSLVDPAGA